MSFVYDQYTRRFTVAGGQSTLEVQDIVNLGRTEESSEDGIVQDPIFAAASGKFTLDTGITTGIDCELADDVDILFEAGTYSAVVKGGNLVGGISGEPIAYSAGVRVKNIQAEGHSISTAGAPSLSDADKEDIAERVFKQPFSDVTLQATGTWGEYLGKKIMTISDYFKFS